MIRLFISVAAVVMAVSHETAMTTGIHKHKIFHTRYSEGGMAWERSDTLCIERPCISDNCMVVRSLWDSDSLYFAFDVYDTNLQVFQTEKDHPRLFLDDMVEVLLDPELDRAATWQKDDIVYHINILGVKKDDKGIKGGVSNFSWDGAARIEVVVCGTINDAADVDGGYRVEIAVPWTETGCTPVDGLCMGVNFANGDNDGCGRQLYNWCDAEPMRTPKVFGTLVLSR